jgi:hypothetical protein
MADPSDTRGRFVDVNWQLAVAGLFVGLLAGQRAWAAGP